METTRQKKVARTVQKELSNLLQFELDELQGILVTVRHVRMTPDLQLARVYITCFPETKLNQILEFLEQEKSRIRYMLGARLRNVVRLIPDLEFFEDDTDREADKIHKLLDKLKLSSPDDSSSQEESGFEVHEKN